MERERATLEVMTQIYGHRGAPRAARENTVAAMVAAVTMGVDGVELDVRRAGDGTLVVHHDPYLAEHRPHWMPTFAEALDACDGVQVNVEIKNDPDEPDFDPDDTVAAEVAHILHRRGGGRRWLVSSFRPETVANFRDLLSTARTALLTTSCGPADVARAAADGHDAIHPFVMVTEPEVRAAHLAGLAVNVWVANDTADIDRLLGCGVDGIVSDVPDHALARRGSR